nr:bifunctional diguanylate cyclase/phosphodiesterase [Oryzisolibacter propanilivorax]
MQPVIPAGTWQAVVDGLQQAVWLIHADTLQMLHANEAAVRLSGRAASAMQGQAVLELASAPQDRIFWQQAPEQIANGVNSCTTLWNPQRGMAIPVERWVQALPEKDGATLLLMSMLDRSECEASTRELEALLSELRATLDSAADGILSCDLQGNIRAFNHRLVQIWQLPDALLTRRDDGAIQAHLQAQVQEPERYRQCMATLRREPLLESTEVFALRNGLVVEQRSVPQLVRGRPTGRVFVFRDISAQLQAQAGLQLAAQVFDSSLDAIFIADAQRTVIRANPACDALLGSGHASMVGQAATDVLSSATPENDLLDQVQAAWQADGFWAGDARLRRQGCADAPVHLSWVLLRDEHGQERQSIGFMRDLAPQHAAQRRIEELAFTDALTGLPNRLQLAQRVESAIDNARGSSTEFAVLFLDLDRFKIVNDSLGHPFGDRVLKLVAQRLQDCLRQSDMLCRLGGDEFVIYLHGAGRPVAESVARRVLDEMMNPFTLDGLGFSVQSSIGIALYPHDGLTLDDLIKQADTAMYRVKERGRGSYDFYRPQMSVNLLSRIKMEHAMRLALSLGQMQAHYQPQVDCASGRIIGMEALLRWNEPQLGAVSPATFIPLAEDCGYIVTLGAWVMEQAVQEAVYWHSHGRPLTVSVNVSALELRQAGFVDRVARLLAEYRLPPQGLELELTESVLLQDAQDMAQLLTALGRLGVRLSIDDFGTGYSSLAYLKKLPIHRLKIDKSFVDGLPDQEHDAAIVQAIISMGRALRIQVVAEGVETQLQRQALQDMGCDFYQGYLCAPALPAPGLRVLLEEQNRDEEKEVSASATRPSS